MSQSETDVLERKKVVVGEEVKLSPVLAEQVEKILKYPELQKKQSGFRLRKTLSDLGIRPFSAESVSQYKEMMLRKYSTNFWRRQPKLSKALMFIFNLLLIFSVSPMFFGWLIAWPLGLGASLSFVISCILFNRLRKICQSTKEWKRVPLEGYKRPVPEFVLNTALEVKSANPHTKFFIEEFVDTKVSDPFLVITSRHKDEEYYCEVWEEPLFNIKRGI